MRIIEYKLLDRIIFEKEQEFIQCANNWNEDSIPKDIVQNLISNLCTDIVDEVIKNLDIVIGITTQK